MNISFNYYFALDNNEVPIRVTARTMVDVEGRLLPLSYTGGSEAEAKSGLMQRLEEMELL